MITLLFKTLRRGALPPILVFGLHVVLSSFRVYDHVPNADVPMHVGGGVAIAIFFARGMDVLREAGQAGVNAPLVDTIYLVALTGTAAIFWEFAEFSVDALGWAKAQNGLADTMLDLALGLAGGLLFALFRTSRQTAT